MRRLSLRTRLTMLFTVAMAVVLVGFGAFVHVRLGAALLEQVDDALAARGADLAAAVRSGDLPSRLDGSDEGFGQVLDPAGGVVASTPGLAGPLLTGPTLARAFDEGRLRTRARVVPPGERDVEQVRVQARRAAGRLVVTAASLDDRSEALAALRLQLLVGTPLALLLTGAGGYLLAGAALRPVAAMRRRAADISADSSGERLPLPRAHDEIHRLGSGLNSMLDRLEAGLQRERRFVADAGHELRTPLALLQTELELALRRPRSAAELTAVLRQATCDVDRLVRLANALLVLASAEEGAVALARAPVATGELLEEVADRFRARAEREGRAVVVDEGPAPRVEGDRLRLGQALGALVDNALRHGAGTVRLGARVGAPAPGPPVQGPAVQGPVVGLRVRDEGPGFAPDLLDRAFERFARGDARVEGAGLGLAVVAAVARAHGGGAAARNLAGGGAEVEIVLPVPGTYP